jgi:hypothetical protein
LLASGIAAVAVTAMFSCTTPSTGPSLTVTFSASSVAASVGMGGMAASVGKGGAGGMAGTGPSTAGKGGMGGMMATSSATGTGMGGQGGAGGSMPLPDKKINGCQLKDAFDLTLAGPNVNITYAPQNSLDGKFSVKLGVQTVPLDPPWCWKIKFNQKVNICLNPPDCSVVQSTQKGSPLIVGGTIDLDMGSFEYDKSSPIQPLCFNGAFPDVNSEGAGQSSCFRGGKWPCGTGNAGLGACNNPSQNSFQIMAYPFFNNSKKEAQYGVLYVLQ